MLSRLKFKTQLMTRAGLLLLTPVLLSGAALSKYGINRSPSFSSVFETSNTNELVRTARTSTSTKASYRDSSPRNQPLGPTSPLAAFAVGWTALLNTTATGSTIEKTSGTDHLEDAGARSTNVITSGDGYVEFQFTAPGKAITVGLNSGRLAFYPFDMEFALSAIGGLNIVEIREDGVYRGDTTYTSTDVLRIEISGTQVLYKKNDVTFYTNTGSIFAYPYHADAVLFDLNARAANVTMTAAAGPEGPLPASNFSGTATPTQVSLSWTDNSNDESGFIIERAISVMNQSPRDWVLVVTTGPNVTTHVDTGLTASTQYFYRLRPFNANGEGRDQSIPLLTPAPTPTPTPTPTATPTPMPTPTPFNVVWTGRFNTTSTGNTIEKTTGQEGSEDARARSANLLDSADGYVEFQFTAAGKALSVGLTTGPQATTRSDLSFAYSTIGAVNIVEIREAGIYRGDTDYTAQDVFRIQISGSQVLYKKNGVTLYANTGPTLTYPYHTDAVLLGIGGRVANAMMSKPSLSTGPLPPSNLMGGPVSSSQINLTWTDNSLDELGFVLERAHTLPGGGLSNWASVVTTGANVVSYSDTTVLPATVYHYRLRSFNNDGESADVMLSGVATPAPTPTPTPTPTPSPTPTPTPTAIFDVEWTGLLNTTATGNNIEKTGGIIGDDGRARSANLIGFGGGFLEWQFPGTGLITVGLNSGPQAATRADMEFALSTINGANIVEVREGGTYKGETLYTASDVFRIEISGTQVLFKKNGVAFYTETSPTLSYHLHGEAVLVTPGVRATNARMSTPVQTTPLLITSETNPTHAAALDSVTFVADPFPLTNNDNFSTDHRTRIILFVTNFELLPGENFHTVVSAHLTSQQGTVNLPVEYVGKVPGNSWLTSVVVCLDQQVVTVGDLTISLTLRGADTNSALITTKP
ncbi:MAG: hypothetical protein ACREBG_10645 [Pyrinomonadaceae bacterium]